MSLDSIIVRGARVHNLKNIDFEIAHNSLTVITGVSGSGKSSLAFDTIYAEGQRRYVESLSAYARQFLERIEKPDVDLVDGIAPGIAIRQKNSTRNPRSTVATATEIYDYLRLFFARAGQTFCIHCGAEVKRDSIDEILQTILEIPADTRMYIIFPLKVELPEPVPEPVKGKKKAEPVQSEDYLKARLFDLRKRGFARLYQNGQIFEFATPESLLDLNFRLPISVLVDRIVVSPDARARIVDSVETCYRESGEVIFESVPRDDTPAQRWRFVQRFECKRCYTAYEDPQPSLFSFNNPHGACPRCQGFGNTIDFDMNLVIPDPALTISGGAVDPWTKPRYRSYQVELKRFVKSKNIPVDVPWFELEHDQRQLIIEGDGKFTGVRGFFALLERKKYKFHVRIFLSRYRGYSLCPMCAGTRLRAEARHVRVAGNNICQVCAMTVEDASRFFRDLQLQPEQMKVAEKLLEQIQERLRYLVDVGLEYLTLDRLSSTLSGGEAQRIQLAASLGSHLVGAMYVLDEPSIGLHSRDTARLVRILHELRDLGNTIVVVEHDSQVMEASDRILDLGPGAGESGGMLMASGNIEEIQANPASLTGKYLRGALRIVPPLARRTVSAMRIKIIGARAHNLKNIDVTIPLGMLVAITGVSGSGKSSLIHDVLYPALAAAKGYSEVANAQFTRVEGGQFLRDVVLVDQSPIGRTPRSNPITYIKAFDAIRELLASLPEARKRGYTPGDFSFNVPGGRCESCQGNGTVTVEMQFLADVELVCEECKGTRYQAGILEVRYNERNIHEILNLTVKEGLHFFSAARKITDKLKVLDEVGLGYLRLGQSATTLSGGEAQRMKLAAHLAAARLEISRRQAATPASAKSRKREHQVLYIFDEPTTGLHFDDVNKLLSAFQRLLDAGASIVVIEHNLDVIKTADWVIDLGPEGGFAGGEVIGVGTPEMLAQNPRSHTGKWLARELSASGDFVLQAKRA